MKLACLFVMGWLAFAGGVDTPPVGFARGTAGSIVRVSGVSGAFVVDATSQDGAVSAAFSGRIGLVKTDTAIRVLDAAGNLVNESDAPAGNALFGFDPAGLAGIAYYPSAQTMMLYRDAQWNPVPFDANGGVVLAVAIKDANRVLAAVRNDQVSVVRIRLVDGAVEDVRSLVSSGGPVLLFGDGGVLFQRDGAAVYRNSNGDERTVAGSADIVELLPMSTGWIQARTASGRSLALRLLPTPRVYELPEVSR